jgi:hypothetical protein
MASPFTSFTNGGSSSNGFFLSPPRPTTTTEDDTHQQQKNTIENPFLARGSPIVTTNSNINKRQHESPASGIRIGQHTPLSHSSIQASELRNRKYNNSPPPPKTSLFLGSTGGNSLAQSLPVEVRPLASPYCKRPIGWHNRYTSHIKTYCILPASLVYFCRTTLSDTNTKISRRHQQHLPHYQMV